MEKATNKTQRDAIINDFIDIPFSFILKIANFVKSFNDSNFWHKYWQILFTIKNQNYDELSKIDIEFICNINSVSMFFEEFNQFLTEIKKLNNQTKSQED